MFNAKITVIFQDKFLSEVKNIFVNKLYNYLITKKQNAMINEIQYKIYITIKNSQMQDQKNQKKNKRKYIQIKFKNIHYVNIKVLVQHLSYQG